MDRSNFQVRQLWRRCATNAGASSTTGLAPEPKHGVNWLQVHVQLGGHAASFAGDSYIHQAWHQCRQTHDVNMLQVDQESKIQGGGASSVAVLHY